MWNKISDKFRDSLSPFTYIFFLLAYFFLHIYFFSGAVKNSDNLELGFQTLFLNFGGYNFQIGILQSWEKGMTFGNQALLSINIFLLFS